MKLKLKTLSMQNFKGIENLTIDFKDDLTVIAGRNGSGKTTVFDAFSYLLFDKDSSGSAQFQIKPLSKTGDTDRNLVTTVSATLLVDDKELKLKKEYQEKWIKKRDALEESFVGNTTNYFVFDLPVKKVEYQNEINKIIDDKMFKLLSDIHYFATMDKKAKREQILNLAPMEESDLKTLQAEYNTLDFEHYTIDQMQKLYEKNISDAKKEIDTLNIRIDEQRKNIKHLDFDNILIEHQEIEKKIKEIEKEKQTAILTQASNTLIKEIETLNDTYAKKLIVLSNKKDNLIAQYKTKIEHASVEETALKTEVTNLENSLNDLSTKLRFKNADIIELRDQYRLVKNQEIKCDTICPVCKQEFPKEKKKEIIKQAIEHKEKELQKITTDGQKLSQEIKTLTEEQEQTQAKLQEVKTKLESLPKLLTMNEVMEKVKEENKPYEDELTALKTQIDEKQELLKNTTNTDAVNTLAKKEEEYRKALQEKETLLAGLQQNTQIGEQIQKYEIAIEDKKHNFLSAAKSLELVKQYRQKYMQLGEQKINDLFKTIQIKLFETQVNGEIAEICEITKNGVPYADLNTASKINAGIELINVISNKLNVYTPLFVDNAESVQAITSSFQQIQLTVTGDTELKVY